MAKPTPWKDEYTLLCEKCGYVVEGLDIAGPCPECGTPIEESLPERRIGTPWQQEPGVKSLVRTWWMTLRHPKKTLDVMRFDAKSSLSPLADSLTIIVLICVLTLVAKPTFNVIELLLGAFLFLLVGLVIWACFYALSGIEALGLQLFGSIQGWRIGPQIGWAVAGHGAVGWLFTGLIWAAGWRLHRLIMYMNPTSNDLELRRQLARHINQIYKPAFLIGLVVGLIIFQLFAYLGLRRCKYANRIRPQESDLDANTCP
ncbi:MAG: hypothetical protein JKX70_03795 [Phycisphaerales bacterium]|nr:hypothetical protein [Phycisphaerales bacterium]